jgi:hypothetical protein
MSYHQGNQRGCEREMAKPGISSFCEEHERRHERRLTINTWALVAVIAAAVGWILYQNGLLGLLAVIVKTVLGGD